MNGERGVLPAMGPAESLRRRLTSGLQGDSGETKLVPGNLSSKKQVSELEGPERASGPRPLLRRCRN